ncbi:MAG TPA: hypothetical protein VGS07_12985 [Thermoanaerobaculia bacterium]|nr:hypothetical protein [Thermoanaerobaculia bacterium]
MDKLNFIIQLQNIHCFDEGDGIGNAEPFLWAVFFKIDGDTAFIDDNYILQGTAQTFGTQGDHGNLNNTNVNAGDDVAVPTQFGYGDTLTPIPLMRPIGDITTFGGVVGCVVILLEQDDTSDAAVASGHTEFDIAILAALNQLIPTLNASHQSPTDAEIVQLTSKVSAAVISAIARDTGVLGWIYAGGNMDDEIGSAVFNYSQDELLSAGPSGIQLVQRWRSEGDWLITGHIQVNNWSVWEDLGGILTSGPAAASWQEGRLDCFVRGTNNHMFHKWFSDSAWSGWEDLGGPPAPPVNALRRSLVNTTDPTLYSQQLASAPAVVSWGPNRIDCFARGVDQHLWHRWWDGVSWKGWQDLGGTITSAPAVASQRDGALDCFARGSNNQLLHRSFDGSVWSGWEDLGGSLTSGPAAISWASGRLDCFVRGTNSHMFHKWWDGSAWSGWEDLGGGLVGAPAVASRKANTLDCFVRGLNNHLFHKEFDGSIWREWEDLGGVLVDSPGAVSWGANRVDCFAEGTNDHLFHKWWG